MSSLFNSDTSAVYKNHARSLALFSSSDPSRISRSKASYGRTQNWTGPPRSVAGYFCSQESCLLTLSFGFLNSLSLRFFELFTLFAELV